VGEAIVLVLVIDRIGWPFDYDYEYRCAEYEYDA